MSSVAESVTARADEVLDFEALLAPIPGENLAGENLQYSGLRDEIREARRADDDIEQGDWKHDLKVADWWQVLGLSTEALTEKSKDLQICAWLAEALVKLHGLAGLRDGLKLMRGLHEQFWDCLYPEIDEGDMDARANALAWMDRQTALAIKEVRITAAAGGPSFSYMQYEESKQFDIPEDLSALEAEQRERIEALKERIADEHKLTTEDWSKAKTASSRAFYEELHALLDECWAEYRALDLVMDEKFGRQTPGLGDLRKTLDAIRSLVGNIVKEKRLAEPYAGELEETGAGEGEEGGAGSGLSAGGSIRARQDAFRRLAEVANYFRINEPHSPVSYLVQRAIKWGQMPLETWLEDVVKDGLVLGSLRETLGLKQALSSEEYDS
ncbi:MAG TPA: type VI secretion system protein TssA [Blastocatellia bacterium]|jgi:type VI secretion system protein ImpA|nr:type VI secretion system protein TssA [Blastocatellia bacterium]